MLENVRIVLVGTSLPRNIGSAARAMKTMGLSRLYLAAPRAEIDGESVALAAGASDILRDVVITDDLAAAIADCALVIGTSARSRTHDWPQLDARQAGIKLADEGRQGPVALVFGRENHGLNNEELQLCHYHVSIPANPQYSSLNLAQAVQLISYETRMAYLSQATTEAEHATIEYPTAAQQEGFYQHLERVLYHTGFLKADQPNQIMTKLRRLFSRARPESAELNILRGVLKAIERSDNSNRDH
ncbi:tRNA (cytosine(32)/uridine(32)-2'-O)-methyltransferase TrmJ [Ferrimonas senticii]|uniref:tRNA (cytosine(32)/uridine(32)-2'-O)-methyltransferase TrmJ n=1 Tax=Ferrimonas senticii TaxID=394566 RepID=UPI00041E2910|nr:tRNA (cytosine(32)/uridine(32)-2'-O)-methyltransferase TrmJ [Ferrimonas senticii]